MTDLAHLDEVGRACERHARAELDPVLRLAAIGSRMSGFNHDIASKIQGLMMAIDEITEIFGAQGNPDLERAAETAHAALQDLNQLLIMNRALTKPPVKSRVTLRELATKAGQRAGVVLKGTLSDSTVEVAVPLVTQGLSLAIDIAAGTGRSRSLEITSIAEELSAPFAATQAAGASESLAIAAWIIARDGGELRCTTDARLVVRFPLAS